MNYSFLDALRERILVFDGAMGTMLMSMVLRLVHAPRNGIFLNLKELRRYTGHI